MLTVNQHFIATKTGRTSLSEAQIATGKTALGNWARAWHAKNLSAHLAYYEPSVIADKVVIRESKEQRSKIDLQQLKSELHQMSTSAWGKAKTETLRLKAKTSSVSTD